MVRINTFLLAVFLVRGTISVAQPPAADTSWRMVVAGDYQGKNNFYRWLWGDHYRTVWTTPVRAAYLPIDTIGGGLTPVRRGGGNQTRTLHLKGANRQDYVIRSINKYYGQALPSEYKGTFVERIIADQASTAHPYAAFTISPMIATTGIYHTRPVLGIVPELDLLDSFKKDFANMFVLLEERADGDQSTTPHFGFSKDVVNTEDMLENVTKNHNHRVDQLAYVKARIFDMFIGDWGRHEDQWRWATFKDGNRVTYKPIPRDRDQAYTLFDGVLLKMALGAAKLKHLQSFDHTIKDVAKFNFPARHLDRRFTNEVSKEDWLRLAREIQHAMTDSVIRYAVSQMPPEAFQLSGEDIIAKLISRQKSLENFASDYYDFLSKEVEVVGSDAKDVFTINKLGGGLVNIKISKPDAGGMADILYDRSFNQNETKEVRLYGLKENDEFHSFGSGTAMTIRIIGGEGNDKVIAPGGVEKKMLLVYDSEPQPETSSGLKVKVTNDTAKNDYKYKRISNDKTGFRFKPGTILGVGYGWRKQGFGKEPFSSDHSIMFEWAFTRGGYALVYRGQINEVIGKWGLAPIVRYDFPYVDHYFGRGNETKRLTEDTKNSFYRVHTKEILAGLGFNRRIDSHFIQLQPFYQSIELDVQPGKFLDLFMGDVPAADRSTNNFGGAELVYRYQKRNDPLTPTKGFGFTASANHVLNFSQEGRDITKFTGAIWGYVPLFKNTTLAIRAGGGTIDGNPVYYQMNSLGGNINLRGYARRRFFGTSSGYNNNEIRWLTNTKNRLFTGQIGLLAFFDQGRIWQKNESSDKWHYGYGGGLIIVPFKRAVLNGTMGFSDEKPVFHARVGFLF